MPQLPDEIWLLVVQYLERQDLKSVRLVSKTLSNVSTPPLFKILTMRPNIDSSQRAASLIQCSALATMVHELHLRDESVFDEPTEITQHMKGFYDRSNDLDSDPASAVVDYAKFFRCRPALRTSERRFDARMSTHFLRDLCTPLPSLRHLSLISHESGGEYNDSHWQSEMSCRDEGFVGIKNDKLRNTFAQAQGLGVCKPRRVFSLELALSAVRDSRLQSVRLSEITYGQVTDSFNSDSSLFDCLRDAKEVTLRLESARGTARGFFGEPHLSPKGTLAFTHLMKSLQGAEAAAICLNRNEDLHCYGQHRLWRIVLQQPWKCLRSLSVDMFVCSELEFLTFLSGMHLTLKNIRMRNISICDAEEDQTQKSQNSVIRTLWLIPHVIILDKFEVWGHLGGCDTESWQTSHHEPAQSKDDKRWQVQDYVCRRQSWPFPELVSSLGYRPILESLDLPLVPARPVLDDVWSPASMGTGSSARIVGWTIRDLAKKGNPRALYERLSDDTWWWEEPLAGCGFDSDDGGDVMEAMDDDDVENDSGEDGNGMDDDDGYEYDDEDDFGPYIDDMITF